VALLPVLVLGSVKTESIRQRCCAFSGCFCGRRENAFCGIRSLL